MGELKALAVPRTSPPAEAARHAALRRASKRLEKEEVRAVGMLAVGAVDVPSLAVELASALGTTASARVAVVVASAARAERWQGDDVSDDPSCALRAIDDRLLLAFPRVELGAGETTRWLRLLLGRLRASCGHVIIDLSELEPTGEYLAAVELVDGVIIAVASKRTRRLTVAALQSTLPADTSLGALLVHGR